MNVTFQEMFSAVGNAGWEGLRTFSGLESGSCESLVSPPKTITVSE